MPTALFGGVQGGKGANLTEIFHYVILGTGEVVVVVVLISQLNVALRFSFHALEFGFQQLPSKLPSIHAPE